MKLLIFSGYNPRAVLSFCRIASEYSLDFDIIASGTSDEILLSEYSKNVSVVRDSNKLSVDVILSICSKYEGAPLFILPSTEFLNRVLISNSKILNDHNIYFGLADKTTYELVSDKLSFGKLCSLNQIATPTKLDTIQVPCVLKPKQYMNSDLSIHTPYLLLNPTDVQELPLNLNLQDFYIQEYVKGESVYLLYYVAKDGSYKVYSQKNYLQQPGGRSILLAKSSLDYTDSTANTVGDMFVNIGFSGLVMVEFRKDKDMWVMIEANPRPWGPSQLTLDSNMGLLDMFLYDNGLISQIKPKEYTPNITYLWYTGFTSNDVRLDSSIPSFEIEDALYNRVDTLKIFKKNG